MVATLPVYAEITKEIGGAEVETSAIANPNEDPHFVRPRPSFALDLRKADAFITTGLDLELWVPTLLDRAANPQVLEGGKGYITAYTGITLLDIPVSADRSGGDVHIYGNPHLTTDPLRTLQVARNITSGLKKVAPERASIFEAGLARFQDRIYRKLFGDRLVELLGGPTLEQLSFNGTLFQFLGDQQYEGHASAAGAGRLAEAGRVVPRQADDLLPQELGVPGGPLEREVRRLRGGQARHPAHARARGRSHQVDEVPEHPGPVRGVVLRPPEGGDGGGAGGRRSSCRYPWSPAYAPG